MQGGGVSTRDKLQMRFEGAQDKPTVSREALCELYTSLVKKCLTGSIYQDAPSAVMPIPGIVDQNPKGFERKWREWGRDVPTEALTMIGLRRMDNIQFCVKTVIADDVPGDLIETGVWRGGATIFMRALLDAYEARNRKVWVADSFKGLPHPDLARYPQDIYWKTSGGALGVSSENVRRAFEIYGLLDDQVRFLPGWFKDTLPAAPIRCLAVLRLDGDLYESTWMALTHLYPKVAPGGFAIIDDFGLPTCRQAVEDYRGMHGVKEPMIDIDGMAVFWRRRSPERGADNDD